MKVSLVSWKFSENRMEGLRATFTKWLHFEARYLRHSSLRGAVTGSQRLLLIKSTTLPLGLQLP
jgi:hypothetical protein